MNVDIGQNEYSIINDFWSTHDNIKIVNTYGSNNTCYIYSSSNGIWEPNTLDAFRQRIVDRDEYEWINMGAKGAKCIFVRDIYKEWYVNGINSKIHSVDKLIDLLKTETANCDRIVCVGSSAGGYLSIILGEALNASYIFCISGQISLYTLAQQEQRYPELNKALLEPNKLKWFDLVPMITNPDIPIFYLYAANCDEDVEQFRQIENIPCVYPFAFSGKHHGNTMYPFNYPYIIQMDKENILELQKQYYGRVISKIEIAMKTIPSAKLVLMITRYYYRKMSRKAYSLAKRLRQRRT